MLQDRNIAFFIDVDNVGLSSENFANIIEQLSAMGSILTGKIYGAGERKHKEIYAAADTHGYRMERPMRIKRRGRKEFDARIFVDVVDAVSRTPALDAVCIVAQGTDLVYLYSYLRAHGIKIVALNNVDEASSAFIDEVLDFGLVEVQKPAKSVKPAAKPVEQPAAVEQAPVEEAQTDDGVDSTDELLKEIERLRALTSSFTAQPDPEPTPVEQQPAQIEEEPAPVQEEPVVEAVDADETPQEPVQEKVTPRAAYAPSNDSDLIRRIEDLRRNNRGDDEDLIDEIRKLLDGLE